MERYDRFVNNRAPKRLLGACLMLFLFSLLAGWLLSGMLADHIMEEQITAMLSAAGGGSFAGAPESAAVAEGEALFRIYGISAAMEPSLMHGYDELRLILFAVIAGCACILCLVFCLYAMHEVDRMYSQLEALRADCFAIAEKLQGSAQPQGEDFGCVRCVCEGVNLIAKRMTHLSSTLRGEKQFLKDFLTDFSHQVKTSLAVVRLNSDMLTELDTLPAEKKQQLSEEITLHLDSMENLVLSALKLAKLNADAVVYEKTEADLYETCTAASRRMRPLLRSKEIALNVSGSAGTIFPHDAVWLCEAIGNLLKNAADHSDCRNIRMELTEIPGAVKLSITDDGNGIPQAEIPKLFERFGKKSNNAVMQSAGVGLAIAKQIIEAHNGEICVYSEIGHGTRFEILFLK